MTVRARAVSLISGGLDSMLATKMVLDQGVDVVGINIYTGFCITGHTQAIRFKHKEKPKRNNALWVADQLGVELHILDVVAEYKDIVIHPKHGYGAHLNPCLDCKGLMVRKAREWMERHGFDFVLTGEVLGQRPKSQLKSKLPIVARDSGTEDLLLRPLSAKLLRPTLPERNGWVDRDRLGAISGRSRRGQIALAKAYGFTGYAQPAGGCCFLTDANYSAKLRDFWRYREKKDYELDDIMLLKVGRHLRPRPHFKMIIARDEGENRFLQGYCRRFTHLTSDSHPGPVVLLDGETNDEDVALAARVTARFGKGRDEQEVRVRVTAMDGSARIMSVSPWSSEQIPEDWYL